MAIENNYFSQFLNEKNSDKANLETEINQHCGVAKNPQKFPKLCGCENDDDKENHRKRLDAQKDALRNRWQMLQPIYTIPR